MTEHRRPPSRAEHRLPGQRPAEPQGGGPHSHDAVALMSDLAADNSYGPATTYGPGAKPPPIPEPIKKRWPAPHHPRADVPRDVPGGPMGPGGPAGPGGPGSRGAPGGPRGPHNPDNRGRQAPAGPPVKRRWIDYPRAGKTGVMRLVPSWKLVTGLAIAFVLSLMVGFVVMYEMTDLPDPSAVNETLDRQATIIYWPNGQEMARLGPTNRVEISIAKMPDHLQNAVLAAENRTFYQDKGFSPTGITRAFINNLRGGDTQGGSTITQQYAKLAFTDSEETLSRKVRELFISIKLEQRYTKQQILEDYLNAAYFGRGAYGVEAAAQVYFRRSAEKLTVQQSAVLAALLRSPEGLYSPKTKAGMARLKERWHYVLDGMVEMGALAPEKAAKARFPTIAGYDTKNRYAGQKGYFIEQVKRELKEAGIDDQTIDTGGLRITLTIDPKLQKVAQEAVEDNQQPVDAKNVQVALAAVEPGTGRLLASYGGPDYLDQAFDVSLQGKVQPGSAFKIFTLAAALEPELNLSLERNAFDGNSPYEFEDGSKPIENEDERDYGQVNLLKATERSINTAFIDAATKAIGLDRVKQAAIDAGIPRRDLATFDASGVIGSRSTTPADLANAYATFAAGGTRAQWHIIEKATYPDGTPVPLKRHTPRPDVFTTDQVAGVDYALKQAVDGGSGTATKARVLEDNGFDVAAKTGTHEEETAWFAGYVPGQISTTVAIFRQDIAKGKRYDLRGYGGIGHVYGGSFPADTWVDFMTAALDGKEPKETFPDYDDSGRNVVQSFPYTAPPPTTLPPSNPPGGGNGGGSNHCPPNCTILPSTLPSPTPEGDTP